MSVHTFAFLIKVYHPFQAVYNALNMRGYTLYIWLGVWLLLLPFLGIPGSWKETLLLLTAIFLIGYSYARHRKIRFEKSAVITPNASAQSARAERDTSDQASSHAATS